MVCKVFTILKMMKSILPSNFHKLFAIEFVVLVVMLFSGGIVGARGLTTPALVLSRLCS